MKIKTFSLVLFLVPVMAMAEPVYLNCNIKSDNGTKQFQVKLDEASGKITHTWGSGDAFNHIGDAFNAEGFFSANSVAYQYIKTSSILKYTWKYNIDRTNLAVTESLKIIDSGHVIPDTSMTMTGSCEIEKVKDRII